MAYLVSADDRATFGAGVPSDLNLSIRLEEWQSGSQLTLISYMWPTPLITVHACVCRLFSARQNRKD